MMGADHLHKLGLAETVRMSAVAATPADVDDQLFAETVCEKKRNVTAVARTKGEIQ